MFSTGIFEKNRYALSADSTLVVAHKGMLWIPVETTMLSKGFTDAWYAAASEFHSSLRQGEPISIIDLSQAWKTYPPAPIPSRATAPGKKVSSAVIGAEVEKLHGSIRAGLEQALDRLESQLPRVATRKDSLQLWNAIGIVNVRSGDYAAAVRSFENARRGREISGIFSNHACAVLLSGDENAAQQELDKVYREDPTGRIAVNRALCLFVKATDDAGTQRFIKALDEARAMMPSSDTLAACLGIDLSVAEQTRASNEHEVQKKQEINLRRLKELIRARILSTAPAKTGAISGTTSETSSGTKMSGTTTETSSGSLADKKPPVVMPFGGIRGADPSQIAKIIDLLYWFEELR
jgi:hypothetical protein